MKDIIPLTVGAAAGGLLLREHEMRTKAERLSAATLETLLNAIDANDAITGAHVRRVAAYALILGEGAGLDERTLRSVERVALFHDIGKLHGALTDIFHEPSKLTPEERRAVMTHPQRGAEVLDLVLGLVQSTHVSSLALVSGLVSEPEMGVPRRAGCETHCRSRHRMIIRRWRG